MPLSDDDLRTLIDITSLITTDDKIELRARDRFLDGVDCFYMHGSLGICTPNGSIEHADWAGTATLLERANGCEPARIAAARRALRDIHEATFGALQHCQRCADHAPTFVSVTNRLCGDAPEDKTSSLPAAAVALGRIRLALRAAPTSPAEDRSLGK